MAQVLVAKDKHWYQGIASLKNLSEKKLEHRFLKCAGDIFQGYHCFQSAYKFSSRIDNDTAAPDVLLIAEDFSQWVIVELELIGKSLTHTRKQLKVFDNLTFDQTKLIAHCGSKISELKNESAKKKLHDLFLNHAPTVLVVFDTYHNQTHATIAAEFNCKICVLEVYRTIGHQFEVYRLSGDYPYVFNAFCYLKHTVSRPNIYRVAKPELFSTIPIGDVRIFHKNLEYFATLSKNNAELYMIIPDNPFEPGTDLKIFKSKNDKLIIELL